MNIKMFAVELAESLTDRGIDSDTARNHVLSLMRTLTEEDLAEIAAYNSKEDFAVLSASLASLIMQKRSHGSGQQEKSTGVANHGGQQTGMDTSDDMKTRTINIQGHSLGDENSETDIDMMKTRVGDMTDSAEQEIYADDASEFEVEISDAPEYRKVKLTSRGAAFFWTIGILTFPLTAGFCIAILAIFAIGFLAVCMLIGASFTAIAADIVVGAGSALVGIIYGIIQVFTDSVGIGLFEIGLGIVFAGMALLVGVLIYNFAVRVLPYVLKQLPPLFRKFVSQARGAVAQFREECNRL